MQCGKFVFARHDTLGRIGGRDCKTQTSKILSMTRARTTSKTFASSRRLATMTRPQESWVSPKMGASLTRADAAAAGEMRTRKHFAVATAAVASARRRRSQKEQAARSRINAKRAIGEFVAYTRAARACRLASACLLAMIIEHK